MGHGTLSSGLLGSVLRCARKSGVEIEDLVRASGVTTTTVEEPDARVDYDAAIMLSDSIAERSGDADFGLHAALEIGSEYLDLDEYLLRSSSTLGAGLGRVARYMRLLSSSFGGRPAATSRPRKHAS